MKRNPDSGDSHRTMGPPETVQVWSPLLKKNIDAEATLAELAEVLCSRGFDVFNCMTVRPDGRVVVAFVTNFGAAQFLSVATFLGPGGADWSLHDSIMHSGEEMSCRTMPYLTARNPGYADLEDPPPPIAVYVMVSFPASRLDHVIQAVRSMPPRQGGTPS